MATYQITSKAGVDFGTVEAASAAEALLTVHRDAGCGDGVVWIRDGDLVFVDDGKCSSDATYREMFGGLDAWDVEIVEEG